MRIPVNVRRKSGETSNDYLARLMGNICDGLDLQEITAGQVAAITGVDGRSPYYIMVDGLGWQRKVRRAKHGWETYYIRRNLVVAQ